MKVDANDALIRNSFSPGTGYDLCICVHAEQNALLTAARFGIAVDGATLTTVWCARASAVRRSCCKPGSRRVFFLEDWSHPDSDLPARIRADSGTVSGRNPSSANGRSEGGVGKGSRRSELRDWSSDPRS